MKENIKALHAPFNFVPLSDQSPFFPNWSEQVSQDIPFSNAVSGSIELDIEAQTPIFVRNGHTYSDRESQNKAYQSFSQIENRYFIPGSSLKGALRNVLEITSFGKLTRVNNDSFAFRDLSRSTDGNKYKEQIKKYPVHAGWLFLKDGHYYIDDCGEPATISAKEIDKRLHTTFHSFITSGNFRSDSSRNARQKYKMLFGKCGRELSDKEFDQLENYLYPIEKDRYLVLTGQPGNRKQRLDKSTKKPIYRNGKEVWEGKEKEFIFKKAPDLNNLSICLIEEDMKAFFSIHKSSDDLNSFWSRVLKKGQPIPVFFQCIPQKETNEKHYYMGLSYMFKYPAKHNVWDAIPDSHKNPKDKKEPHPAPDLSELLFGYTGSEHSLKGRVQVGHAFAIDTPDNPIRLLGKKEYALSSPKPSYYPLYLRYNTHPVSWNNDFNTSIQIAGFKRYPVRKKSNLPNLSANNNTVNQEMKSSMIPLCQGSRFKGRITFHNLRPEELGALLYAITLSLKPTNEPQYCHQIGNCKPYGYGAVHITPTLRLSPNTNEGIATEAAYYLQQYDKLLKTTMNSQWEECESIRELKAMAEGIPQGQEKEFTYMQMSTIPKENEFLSSKTLYAEGERLGLFTQIISGKVKAGIPPLSTQTGQSGKTFQTGNRYKLFPTDKQRKGWELKTEVVYEGFITPRNQLSVKYPQDPKNQNKNIYKDYHYDRENRIYPRPRESFKFKITQIDKDCITILVTSK